MPKDNTESEKNKKTLSIITAEYDLAKLKYENELRREDSLIQQAGYMQNTFAFTTAALFMALTVLVQYREPLSLEFFLFAGTTITLVLLLSLFFATLAQKRKMQALFPPSKEIIKYIEDNEENFETEEQRLKYYANTYAETQESLTKNNQERCKWIIISMWCFYVAIGLCLFWIVVGVCKLI